MGSSLEHNNWGEDLVGGPTIISLDFVKFISYVQMYISTQIKTTSV